MRDAGRQVMGRSMYEVMGYWDTVDPDPSVADVEREFATFWQETPKHVASRGPRTRPNATIIEGDVVDSVRRLRRDGPDIGLGAARSCSRRSPRPTSSTSTGWSSAQGDRAGQGVLRPVR